MPAKPSDLEKSAVARTASEVDLDFMDIITEAAEARSIGVRKLCSTLAMTLVSIIAESSSGEAQAALVLRMHYLFMRHVVRCFEYDDKNPAAVPPVKNSP